MRKYKLLTNLAFAGHINSLGFDDDKGGKDHAGIAQNL